MTQVNVRDGEPVDRAVRRFQRKIESSGLMRELKRRRHYKKPSEAKKEKAIVARRRANKARRASR